MADLLRLALAGENRGVYSSSSAHCSGRRAETSDVSLSEKYRFNMELQSRSLKHVCIYRCRDKNHFTSLHYNPWLYT
jgi:hypothetical protein